MEGEAPTRGHGRCTIARLQVSLSPHYLNQLQRRQASQPALRSRQSVLFAFQIIIASGHGDQSLYGKDILNLREVSVQLYL